MTPFQQQQAQKILSAYNLSAEFDDLEKGRRAAPDGTKSKDGKWVKQSGKWVPFKGEGSGRKKTNFHPESDVAIHENAKEIAAHAGITEDEYKKLHPGTKKELLKNALKEEEVSKVGESKKDENHFDSKYHTMNEQHRKELNDHVNKLNTISSEHQKKYSDAVQSGASIDELKKLNDEHNKVHDKHHAELKAIHERHSGEIKKLFDEYKSSKNSDSDKKLSDDNNLEQKNKELFNSLADEKDPLVYALKAGRVNAKNIKDNEIIQAWGENTAYFLVDDKYIIGGSGKVQDYIGKNLKMRLTDDGNKTTRFGSVSVKYGHGKYGVNKHMAEPRKVTLFANNIDDFAAQLPKGNYNLYAMK